MKQSLQQKRAGKPYKGLPALFCFEKNVFSEQRAGG